VQAGARPVSQAPAPTDLAGHASQLRSGILVQKMDGSSDQPPLVSKTGRTSAPLGLEPVQSPRCCTSEEDQNGSTKAAVKILVRIQGVRTKRSMANLIVSSRPSCSTRCLNMVNGWLTCLNDNPPHCVLVQLKSGHTSAPRLPQAWQTNRPSMSDSLTSSGQWSALTAIKWLQR
jgi:hypothetical protein